MPASLRRRKGSGPLSGATVYACTAIARVLRPVRKAAALCDMTCAERAAKNSVCVHLCPPAVHVRGKVYLDTGPLWTKSVFCTVHQNTVRTDPGALDLAHAFLMTALALRGGVRAYAIGALMVMPGALALPYGTPRTGRANYGRGRGDGYRGPRGRGGPRDMRDMDMRDAPRRSGMSDEEGRPGADWANEAAELGGEFVYGVNSVLAALRSKRRVVHKLLVQDTMQMSKRKDAAAVREVEALAASAQIPVERCDKGSLNGMCGNRPHQGLVLLAQPLEFETVTSLPPPAEDGTAPLWLALDEVTDPQNFGALLRSAHFLGADGVIVSLKNSAPLTPVVSKASAGAMELMQARVVARRRPARGPPCAPLRAHSPSAERFDRTRAAGTRVPQPREDAGGGERRWLACHRRCAR